MFACLLFHSYWKLLRVLFLFVLSSASMTVSQVCLYPVKSCGALSVDSWPLDDRGLLYDRCWMVVTDLGVALTQKQETRLCLIKPLIDLQKGVLTLTFEGECLWEDKINIQYSLANLDLMVPDAVWISGCLNGIGKIQMK